MTGTSKPAMPCYGTGGKFAHGTRFHTLKRIGFPEG